jgi:histone H1/5
VLSGGPVETAVNEFLSGEGELHETTRAAITRGGSSAVGEIAAFLTAKFKLSSTVATLVATLLVKLFPSISKLAGKKTAAKKKPRRKAKAKTKPAAKKKTASSKKKAKKKTSARPKTTAKKSTAKKKKTTSQAAKKKAKPKAKPKKAKRTTTIEST